MQVITSSNRRLIKTHNHRSNKKLMVMGPIMVPILMTLATIYNTADAYYVQSYGKAMNWPPQFSKLIFDIS